MRVPILPHEETCKFFYTVEAVSRRISGESNVCDKLLCQSCLIFTDILKYTYPLTAAAGRLPHAPDLFFLHYCQSLESVTV
jgi:hypothetical protein